MMLFFGNFGNLSIKRYKYTINIGFFEDFRSYQNCYRKLPFVENGNFFMFAAVASIISYPFTPTNYFSGDGNSPKALKCANPHCSKENQS